MACDLTRMLEDFFENIRTGECILCGRSRLEQLNIPFSVFKHALLALGGSDLIRIESLPRPIWVFKVTIDEVTVLEVQIAYQPVGNNLKWIVSLI